MRTESDLRDAVRERADRAPSAHLLTARAPVARPHRRTPAVAAAALVTAAVATGAVVVASTIGSGASHHPNGAALHTSTGSTTGPVTTNPPASPPPSLIDDTVRVSYDGPGAVQYDESTEAQYVQLRGGVLLRDVTAYGKGLFSPSSIEHRRAVTVNGFPGYVGVSYPWFGDDLSHTGGSPSGKGDKWADPLPILAWRVAAGQWLSVASDAPGEGNLAGLKAIARYVHAARSPVTTPIKIGYLPSGQRLSNVEDTHAGGGYPASSLLGFRRNDRYGYWNWDVSVSRAARSGGSGGGHVNGRGPTPHPVDPDFSRVIGGYRVTVQTLGAISKAEAKKVLASVTLASSPSHPNRSWFDVAQALP